MTTPVFKGEAANFVWGIPDGLVTVSGRITSIRKSRTIDTEELQDTNGEVDGVVFLDPKTGGTIDVIIPSTFTDVELAASLTVDGSVCFVTQVEKQWERRGWAAYTLTISGWDAVSAGT